MASVVDEFFAPESVAVAGASRSGGKLGNVPIANLKRFGFRGRVVPIHPEGGEIMGLKAYPSMEAMEGGVDVAVAVIPRELIPRFLESCGRAGVKNVIISAAGFADVGGDGADLQREVTDTARRLGIRVMGPNSIGTINTSNGFVTSIITLDTVQQGVISIVAQTGLFAAGFARWIASSQVFGLAKVACLGNKGDVDEVDVLSYLKDDDATRVIAVHTEGVNRGRELMRLVSELSPIKPVVIVKTGRTDAGRRAARSHTASLSGSFEVFRGALAQAGAVTVDSFTELFDCAKALASCPRPAGNRVGVVSMSGAGCVLAADACEVNGLRLPPLAPATQGLARRGLPPWASFDNPADIWPAVIDEGSERGFSRVLRALLGQEDIDLVVVIHTLAPESDFDIGSVLESALEDFRDKPVLSAVLGASREEYQRWFRAQERAGVPTYDSVERAMRAAGALCRYSGWRRDRLAGTSQRGISGTV